MFEFLFSFRFILILLATIGVCTIWHWVEQAITRYRDQKRMDELADSVQFGQVWNLEGDDIRKFFDGELVLTHSVYIKIPESLDPETRGSKYARPIDEELTKRMFGEVTGGGTMVGKYCGIDVSLNDFNDGIACLRMLLQKLEAPKGTVIESECGELAVYPTTGG